MKKTTIFYLFSVFLFLENTEAAQKRGPEDDFFHPAAKKMRIEDAPLVDASEFELNDSEEWFNDANLGFAFPKSHIFKQSDPDGLKKDQEGSVIVWTDKNYLKFKDLCNQIEKMTGTEQSRQFFRLCQISIGKQVLPKNIPCTLNEPNKYQYDVSLDDAYLKLLDEWRGVDYHDLSLILQDYNYVVLDPKVERKFLTILEEAYKKTLEERKFSAYQLDMMILKMIDPQAFEHFKRAPDQFLEKLGKCDQFLPEFDVKMNALNFVVTQQYTSFQKLTKLLNWLSRHQNTHTDQQFFHILMAGSLSLDSHEKELGIILNQPLLCQRLSKEPLKPDHLLGFSDARKREIFNGLLLCSTSDYLQKLHKENLPDAEKKARFERLMQDIQHPDNDLEDDDLDNRIRLVLETPSDQALPRIRADNVMAELAEKAGNQNGLLINVHASGRDRRTWKAIDLFKEESTKKYHFDPKSIDLEIKDMFAFFSNRQNFPDDSTYHKARVTLGLEKSTDSNSYGPLIGGHNDVRNKEILARMWHFTRVYDDPKAVSVEQKKTERQNALKSFISGLASAVEHGDHLVCDPGKIQRLVISLLQGRIDKVNVDGEEYIAPVVSQKTLAQDEKTEAAAQAAASVSPQASAKQAFSVYSMAALQRLFSENAVQETILANAESWLQSNRYGLKDGAFEQYRQAFLTQLREFFAQSEIATQEERFKEEGEKIFTDFRVAIKMAHQLNNLPLSDQKYRELALSWLIANHGASKIELLHAFWQALNNHLKSNLN